MFAYSLARRGICVYGNAKLVFPQLIRFAGSVNSTKSGNSNSIHQLYEENKPLRDENVHITSKGREAILAEARNAEIEKIEQNIRRLATPKQMKAYLDNFVIGQENCKRTMAVAIYNHYLRANDNMIREIKEGGKKKSHNTNSNESGHREMPGSKEKAKLALEFSKSSSSMEAPELEKSNLMLIGPSGSGKTLMAKTLARVLNVPIVIQDCTALTQAGYIGEDIADCIQKLFAKSGYNIERCGRGIIVLDEVDKLAKRSVMNGAKDISGEGVQQSLLKLIEGSQVPVEVKKDESRPFGGSTESQDITVDSSNILFIAMGAFVGLDDIIAKRLADDADVKDSKQKETKNKKEKDSKPVGSSLEKVIPDDLVRYGMIPEFVGRLPVIATLKNLTADDLERVLVRPKNSLIRQYIYTFKRLGIQLAVTGPALQAVAGLSLKRGIGARGLHSILSKVLLSANYDCPGSDISYVLVDKPSIEDFIACSEKGIKSFDNFKPKYFKANQHEDFLDMIKNEDPKLETRLRYDVD